MKLGADAFLEGSMELAKHNVVLEAREATREPNGYIAPRSGDLPRFPQWTEQLAGNRPIVGTSAVVRGVLDRISAAARSRSTVLITGESGTGKELVARAIHSSSGAPGRPFIPVTCAGLHRGLVESELFGGSEATGLFSAAAGGTLLLDDVTEMPQDAQAILLRVLQERAFRPAGSAREIPTDVRVIATTNRDPLQAVAEGRLREDLYYRLSVVPIAVPALRERPEDIPLLVEHFIRKLNDVHQRTIEGAEPSVLAMLQAHAWPGNVRELENVLEAAFHFCRTDRITAADLPATLSRARIAIRTPDAPGEATPQPALPAPAESGEVVSLKEAEKLAILRAIRQLNGNKSLVAKALGISRKQLYVKLACFGLGDPATAG